MAITREDVLHVARLARLALSEEEIERLGGQLNDILAAVSKVSELDLSEVEPTSHPLDLVNVFAEDEPRPSLSFEDALANAPHRERGFFRVPPPGARAQKTQLRDEAVTHPYDLPRYRDSRGAFAPPRGCGPTWP